MAKPKMSLVVKPSLFTRLWQWGQANPKKALGLAGVVVGAAVGGSLPLAEVFTKALAILGAG